MRKHSEILCVDLQRRLNFVSESEKALKARIADLNSELDVGNKLETIRLDHIVSQLSTQIEVQVDQQNEAEEREAQHERISLQTLDRLQKEWLRVLEENHLRQKKAQSRIEELEHCLEACENRFRVESEMQELCHQLQTELLHSRQINGRLHLQLEAAERKLQFAEEQAGAGHEAKEVHCSSTFILNEDRAGNRIQKASRATPCTTSSCTS
jgi:hypothetical protein